MSAAITAAVVGVAGSAMVAKQQGKAAQKAAGQSSDAASYAADLQQQQFEQQRKDTTPWRQSGGAAVNRLAELMGLSGTGMGGMAGTGTGGAYTGADLVDRSQGDWQPNQDLYSSSPEYKQAWDQFLAGHQAQFGVNPNDARGSVYNNQFDALLPGINAQQQQTQAQAQQAPGFGSLTKNFSMADFEQDPGYAFRMSEGMKALDRSAAARGGLLSGAQLKGISRYGQDMASQEYGNAYNRFQTNQNNLFNRLSGIAGTGQTSVNQMGQAGQNYANSAGNIAMNNAANQGNAAMAQGNANASMYQGLGNALGRYVGDKYGGGVGNGTGFDNYNPSYGGGSAQFDYGGGGNYGITPDMYGYGGG